MKYSFKNLLIWFLFYIYLLSVSLFFIVFNNYYVQSIERKYEEENINSLENVRNIISEEKIKSEEEALTMARDGMIFVAFKNGLYIWGAPSEGNKIIAKKMDRIKYLNLANKYKSSRYGNTKEVALFDENRELLSYTGNISKDLLKKITYKVNESWEKRTTTSITSESHILESEDRIFIVGASDVVDSIKNMGRVVNVKEIDSQYIIKLKKIANKEIFILKNGEVINSTLRINDQTYKGKIDISQKIDKIENVKLKSLFYDMEAERERIEIGTGYDYNEIEKLYYGGIKRFIFIFISIIVVIACIMFFGLRYIFKSFDKTLKIIDNVRDKKYNIEMNNFREIEFKKIGNAIGNLAKEVEEREESLKNANTELEKMTESLEIKVFDRTKELEAALTTKDKFIANISHEMRTPLNGIISMSSLYKYSMTDEEKKENIDIINKSAKHLLSIINSILDFASLKYGHKEVMESEFELEVVIRDVCSLFSHEVIKKKINLYVYIDPHLLGKYFGDKVKIMQILINLVGNAVKFTDNGHVFLKCEKKASFGENRIICFEISDTGMGVSEKDLAGIFEPFIKGEKSSASGKEGTGLGLSITKELVEVLGSKINCFSSRKGGTVFTFDLNLKMSEKSKDVKQFTNDCILITLNRDIAEMIEKPASKYGIGVLRYGSWNEYKLDEESGLPFEDSWIIIEDKLMDENSMNLLTEAKKKKIIIIGEIENSGFKNIRGVVYSEDIIDVLKKDIVYVRKVETRIRKLYSNREIKVLLIEDNEINIKGIEKISEILSFSLDSVKNGIGGLKQFEERSYDAVIVDVHLPDGDGIEIAKKIKTLNEDTKVLLFTAAVNDVRVKESLKGDVDGCIYKPYEIEDFVKVFSTLFKYSESDELISTDLSEKEKQDIRDMIIKALNEILKNIKDKNGGSRNIVHKMRGSAGMLKNIELNEILVFLEEKCIDMSEKEFEKIYFRIIEIIK